MYGWECINNESVRLNRTEVHWQTDWLRPHRLAARCHACPTASQRSLPVPTGLELGTDPNHAAGRDPKSPERRRGARGRLRPRAAPWSCSLQRTWLITRAFCSASWTSKAWRRAPTGGCSWRRPEAGCWCHGNWLQGLRTWWYLKWFSDLWVTSFTEGQLE